MSAMGMYANYSHLRIRACNCSVNSRSCQSLLMSVSHRRACLPSGSPLPVGTAFYLHSARGGATVDPTGKRRGGGDWSVFGFFLPVADKRELYVAVTPNTSDVEVFPEVPRPCSCDGFAFAMQLHRTLKSSVVARTSDFPDPRSFTTVVDGQRFPGRDTKIGEVGFFTRISPQSDTAR